MDDYLDKILRSAVGVRATDIHIVVGDTPRMRIRGELVRMEGYPKITPDVILAVKDRLLPPDSRDLKILTQRSDVDFAYSIPGFCRFRVNGYVQRSTYAFVFRRIDESTQTLEELGLPEILNAVTSYRKGLVLVTGQTGSGKSTTMAAMVNSINAQRPGMIITIEDPIEYTFRHNKCLVVQRQLGKDTPNYASGLRAALREDPDVIVIGEMRDSETIEVALRAAETGHLVISTLHTNNAASTVTRIIDSFEGNTRASIMKQLAMSVKVILNQALVPHQSGKGVVLACEMLWNSKAVESAIAAGEIAKLAGIVEDGNQNNCSLDKSLANLYKQNKISEEHMLEFCTNPDKVRQYATF